MDTCEAVQHDTLTLADISNGGLPVWHVCAEQKGYRYYLGTAVSKEDCEKLVHEYRTLIPSLNIYMTDKSDGTRIHFTFPTVEQLLKACK